MVFKKMFAAFIVFSFFPLSVFAADPPPVKGIFSRVPGQDYKFDGKVVDVVEFLSFYCGHCYEFEQAIPVIRGNFPKKIRWKILPIYWGSGSSKPGEAYLLAEDAGKGDQMKAALFHANFIDKKDIGDLEVLESISTSIGLDFNFSRRLRGGEKEKEVQAALEMAQAYGIRDTPSLVIAGNIMTNPHLVNHDMAVFRVNVITILGSILGK